MAKYRVRTAPFVSGTPTTPRKWTDQGTFEIGDPGKTENWVTTLNINRADLNQAFSGTVRYEKDKTDSTCDLTTSGTVLDGWFSVSLNHKPSEGRKWKLLWNILSLNVESTDNGFTLNGSITTNGTMAGQGERLQLEAIKYTPDVTLEVKSSKSSPGQLWKRCMDSNNNPINYYYKFEGGDDNEGGLIIAKGRTKVLKLSLSPGLFMVRRIRWTKDSHTWSDEMDFSDPDSAYISCTNHNSSENTATSNYCIGVVLNGGTDLIWCDPVIKNKPT